MGMAGLQIDTVARSAAKPRATDREQACAIAERRPPAEIIRALGAHRKPRDQHRDNKTLLSNDFAEVEEASAHRAGAPPGNRGSVFLPFRRAIPALSGRKPAETGRDTPRHQDNPRVGGRWSTRLPGRREREIGVVPFVASSDEWRTVGVV